MRTNLDAAIGRLGGGFAVDVVDVGTLSESDYRTGYGTPTILRDGADLAGAERPQAASPT